MRVRRIRWVLCACLCVALGAMPLGCDRVRGQSGGQAPAGGSHGHVFFRVQAPSSASASAPLSGRLLLFLRKGSGDEEVDTGEFNFGDTWVAAREVRGLAPGGSVEVDADAAAFPKPFSTLSAGNYEAQAVLDVDHTYNYSGRGPEDWISDVAALDGWTPGSGAEPSLILDGRPHENILRKAALLAAKAKAALAGAQEEDFNSPSLSRFWGHPVAIRAWVIVPPGYSGRGGESYPTAYWTQGFGGTLESALARGLHIYDRMKNGQMPPMIWVMLDESIPQGTHEFADSVNNGPWGTALTGELIPYLEAKYHMDARPSGRFLNGHSSGGWATLQLQVNYPGTFGGTWSTSPDSSNFHDFNGVDLYAPGANLYRRPDGSAVPIVRENGKVVATMEEFGRLEEVLGPYGGQLSSFDWVFSPKGADGGPKRMFDRQTGQIDPAVIAYWGEHYDLAHLVEANWAARGAALKGRIHVAVGTADTFYLDGAAHRFQAVLDRLGADEHFTYLPGRTHFNIYEVGGDPEGLFNEIGTEMYAVARPGLDWRQDK